MYIGATEFIYIGATELVCVEGNVDEVEEAGVEGMNCSYAVDAKHK